MHVIYTRQPTDLDGLRQNPRFFKEPLTAATKVTIDGDYPEIEGAYRALGVQVVLKGEAPIAPEPQAPVPAELVAQEWPPTVEIPEDWADLSWPKLRKLAQACSRDVVLNKVQASEAIEAELGRREAEAEVDRFDADA